MRDIEFIIDELNNYCCQDQTLVVIMKELAEHIKELEINEHNHIHERYLRH
jgi:hypothetical protein